MLRVLSWEWLHSTGGASLPENQKSEMQSFRSGNILDFWFSDFAMFNWQNLCRYSKLWKLWNLKHFWSQAFHIKYIQPIHTFDGIWFSYRKNEALIHAIIWMNPKNITPGKIRQTQRDEYKWALTWNTWIRPIHNSSNLVRGYKDWRGNRVRSYCFTNTETLFRWWKGFENT